ncbi:MAG: FAD-dependent monooxygenase [Pseudomonadota bacterium]|nr:FAD-dependent monooxygenase [Pseudomonadota bacterium]
MTATPILIIGAGPSGLLLALRLARHGVAFRIIDKNPGPGLASRAMVVQARTLEFYDQVGLADKIISEGIIVDTVHLRRDRHEAAVLKLASFGQGLGPYPFALSFPQDDHEKFLVAELKAMGVSVEWNTALQDLGQDENQVTATLLKDGKSQTAQFRYACGCDGAHSKTREILKLDFAGGTYSHIFYVADVKLVAQPDVQAQVNLGDDGFALQFPIRSSGMNRLIGVAPDAAEKTEHPIFADLQHMPERLLDIKVQEVNWFSTYHVHHRVAAHFNVGRVFLLGDAGHVHSPVGGQGLNTGLGDAVNLSWKLAHVLQNRASPALLQSYEPERIAFARKLVATTDRAFTMIVSGGMQARLMRNLIVPYLIPLLLKFGGFRRFIFKTISQIMINYRDSPLSNGKGGAIQAGDRLPFVASLDNFKPLRKIDWQLHIYGEASAECSALCAKLGLTLVTFAFTDQAMAAGFAKDALYLIRPDGHVAFASQTQNANALQEYLSDKQIVFS